MLQDLQFFDSEIILHIEISSSLQIQIISQIIDL
jgi:hypothetical protein